MEVAMPAQLIDGKALASEVMEKTKAEVQRLAAKGHIPHLVAVMVGQPAASRMYVKRQQTACQDLALDFTLVEVPEDASQEDLEAEIHKLNGDPSVTGVILQMPLPAGLDGRRAQRLIAPEKDVEGVTPASLGLVVLGDETAAPTTARAAFELAKSSGVKIEGAEVVIVGHSEIVGKPLALLFLKAFGTTTVCHIATKDVAAHARKADILCVAVGKAGLIRADMIKPGAVVIDVGINRIPKKGPDGKQVFNEKGKPEMMTVGDVDFEPACNVAGAITPVPGGVGQVTVAMLMSRTVGLAAKLFER
jgi:methylenetetrahydrofolate dehydrogenase (NADP+)/methenyltetrahydrofolate cyclohydrolase